MPVIELKFRIDYTSSYDSDIELSDNESDNEDSVDNVENTKPLKTQVKPDLTKFTPNDMLYGTIDYIEKYYIIKSMKWSSDTVIKIVYSIKPECKTNDKQNKTNIRNEFLEHPYLDCEYGGSNNGWVWCDEEETEYALTKLVVVTFYTDKGKEVTL